MTAPAIRVQGLWKEYRVGTRATAGDTFYDLLAGFVRRAAGRKDEDDAGIEEARHFWALRDIGFEIQPGEVVGIIGRNGAGKSTLLKILSRITAPTRGRIEIRGRLASLLEVGTGFHPELTGRENIFLNGAILGMSRREVARKFDEIVAFAEVERFIDTPVKRYSSGMYVRLAFAVAAHLEADVLLVDEVLAVGDATFQRRCLGKMKDISDGGRTVLFVSHNMQAVQRLCARAVWLEQGCVKANGPVSDVVQTYLRIGSTVANTRHWDVQSAPSSEHFRLLSVEARLEAADVSNSDGPLRVDRPFNVEFVYDNLTDGAALNLSVHIYTSDDTLVLNAIPVLEREWFKRPFPAGRYRCCIRVPANMLNVDTYRVELLAVHDQHHVVFRHDSVLFFELHDAPLPIEWHGRLPGVVRPLLEWRTERLA